MKLYANCAWPRRWIGAPIAVAVDHVPAAAGVRAIDVCSFVPAKLIPQFVDAEEVRVYANAIPGMMSVVLVPNFKGGERALAAGARRVTVPVSVSEAHSTSNVRKSTARALEDFARVAGLPKGYRPFMHAA